MLELPKFEDWLKLQEGADGTKSAPRKTKTVAHDDKNPKGVRKSKDDVSKDYPGHIDDLGDEGAFEKRKKA